MKNMVKDWFVIRHMLVLTTSIVYWLRATLPHKQASKFKPGLIFPNSVLKPAQAPAYPASPWRQYSDTETNAPIQPSSAPPLVIHAASIRVGARS